MSVPKKQKTHGKTRRGRNAEALKKTNLLTCKKCGNPVMPHIVCSFCGFYKDREVLKIKK